MAFLSFAIRQSAITRRLFSRSARWPDPYECIPLHIRKQDLFIVLGNSVCQCFLPGFQHLGNVARSRGDLETAQARYTEALRLYVRLGNIHPQAGCHLSLGDVESAQSNLAGARSHYQTALQLFSRTGDQHAIAATNLRLAPTAPLTPAETPPATSPK